MATIPDNFLGLPAPHGTAARARYAVLPIPYDSTTSFQVGTRNGPRAILTASQQVELYDEELDAEAYRAGVWTAAPLAPEMAGPDKQVKAVHAAARPIVRAGQFLIGLGGEHSITAGLVRAVMERHKPLTVLQIDAHADLRDEYEGTPHSHACAMRRVLDLGAKLVAVGIRNYSRDEQRFMQRRGIAPVSARECHADPNWIERVVARLDSPIYVTIDIDGLDPAYAPGTGTPEPGGLTWFQVVDLLRAVTRAHRVVAADLVEVMPLPGSMQTEFLAAKLIYKLIGYVETGVSTARRGRRK
ncbi:MAG: agmatinase [Phycisphaerae bacterium]